MNNPNRVLAFPPEDKDAVPGLLLCCKCASDISCLHRLLECLISIANEYINMAESRNDLTSFPTPVGVFVNNAVTQQYASNL